MGFQKWSQLAGGEYENPKVFLQNMKGPCIMEGAGFSVQADLRDPYPFFNSFYFIRVSIHFLRISINFLGISISSLNLYFCCGGPIFLNGPLTYMFKFVLKGQL